jgi:hypothetical protein
MQAPASHHLDLYRYWLSKRGARIMPARSDIDPAGIQHLMPHLVITERAGDQFHYRLVGSAVVQTTGHDATGVTVGSYMATPDDAAPLRSMFRRVFTAACPIFATGEYHQSGRASLCLSALTLPLSDDDRTTVTKTISTLAACVSPELKPDRGWLAGVPMRVSNVYEVRNTAELETLCCEWERFCGACN